MFLVGFRCSFVCKSAITSTQSTDSRQGAKDSSPLWNFLKVVLAETVLHVNEMVFNIVFITGHMIGQGHHARKLCKMHACCAACTYSSARH